MGWNSTGKRHMPGRRPRTAARFTSFTAGLVILGVALSACAVSPSHAAVAHRGRTAKVTRAVEQPLSAEDAFVQARRYAMSEPNADRFEQFAGQAMGVTELAPYIEYWRLRLRMADRRQDGDPDIDAAAERFLQTQSNTIAGDMLRRDWMLNLGRRQEWSRFMGVYSQWVLRDDSQVECYKLTGSAVAGENVAAAARALLLQQREYSEGCNTLVDAMAANGAFSRDDLTRLQRGALENNAPNTLRRIGLLLGLDPDRLDRSLNKPALALADPAGRDYDMIALVRLARQDPSAAAARLPSLNFDAADTAFAWAQIAAAGMRRLDPEALTWTRNGLGAQASDETWGWLARAALREQDWKTLHTVIGRMTPDGQREPTWVYWEARALKATGRAQEGDALLRTIAGQYHFYGQLAAEDLGQLTAPPPRAAQPTDAEIAAAGDNAGFARALKFYDLGLRFEGNREWNFQIRGMNDRQLLAAAQWACRKEVLDRCVNTADRTTEQHDFSLRFVSPFLDQLRPVAREQGLDPAWVYGLIRQESRFIMTARSSVGAQGLMQMMPSTARWVARKMGVSGFQPSQLNELDTNLRFGTFYLKTVFDDLDGSPLLASAAYNAGPGRPRNWRSTLPGNVEGAVFAEIIPFSETRDYVKKVLSNTTYYAALFSGRPQSLKSRLGMVSPASTSLATSDAP